MPHEWIDKPKKRRGQTEKEPSFRQISRKQELEIYRAIGYNPEAEHNPHDPPQTIIHNVLEEDTTKEQQPQEQRPSITVHTPITSTTKPKIKDMLSDGIS